MHQNVSVLKRLRNYQVRNCRRHHHQHVHVRRPVLDRLVGRNVKMSTANELKEQTHCKQNRNKKPSSKPVSGLRHVALELKNMKKCATS